MGEQARGQSYDLKEQHEEVISPSRDMNKCTGPPFTGNTAMDINHGIGVGDTTTKNVGEIRGHVCAVAT